MLSPFLIAAWSTRLQSLDPTRSPIRLHFDTSPFKDHSSPEICFIPEDEVVVSNFGDLHVCTMSDVVTDEKLKVLSETFDNVRLYLNSLISVSPSVSPITVVEPWFTGEGEYRATHESIDFLVLVVPRILPPGVLASSMLSDAFHRTDGRPEGGVLEISIGSLPQRPQDISDHPRELFMTLLHEMFHFLAFRAELYPRWIDRRVGKRYNPPVLRQVDPPFGRGLMWSVISSPELSAVVATLFGTPPLWQSSGLVLHNKFADSPHVDLDHSRALMFADDVTNPLMRPSVVVSNISLAGLYDSGWYDVDFAMAEPVTWANYSALGLEKPLTGLLTEAGNRALPASHKCEAPNDAKCYVDPRFTGDCRGLKKLHCEDRINPDWADCPLFFGPDEMRDFGDREYEGAKVLRTGVDCRGDRPASATPFESYGPESFCAVTDFGNSRQAGCYRMECSAEGALAVTVGGETVRCQKGGEEVRMQNGGRLKCPDVTVTCDGGGSGVDATEFTLTVVGVSIGCASLAIGAAVGVRHFLKHSVENNNIADMKEEAPLFASPPIAAGMANTFQSTISHNLLDGTISNAYAAQAQEPLMYMNVVGNEA
jgi:hypothetical protein